MKCPKCGYNSFEYHNSCKKCASDLGAYKQTHNIIPLVLPPEAREQKAEEFRSASSGDDRPVENVETHDDMFAFDLPEDIAPSSAAAPQNDDPFNFDDDPPVTGSQQANVDDGGFSDLLETTAQPDADPFALYTAPAAAPAAAAASTSGPGEFDLENFSWDDTPAPAAASVATSANDDFDSLFGDTGDSAKK
jgi:predicted  nucleic acid-binding Zn-ribbon protein